MSDFDNSDASSVFLDQAKCDHRTKILDVIRCLTLVTPNDNHCSHNLIDQVTSYRLAHRFERATEIEYPIEALIEMAITSFLDLERSVLQIANQDEVSRALLKPVVLEQRKLSRERLSEVA